MEKREKFIDQVANISQLWNAILCAALVLRHVELPIRLYTGGIYGVLILVISLVLLLFFLKNGRNQRQGVVCVMVAIVTLLMQLLSPARAIDNPFTPHKFVGFLETNFLGRGTVSYYQRIGFLLILPQHSEYGEFSGDDNYVGVSRDCIYVNMTFMGAGAEYPIANKHVNLRWKNLEKITLSKNKFTLVQSIELTRDKLSYSNSKGNEKSRPLTGEEYRQLRAGLERMELLESGLEQSSANMDDPDWYYYQLSVTQNGDPARYYADVDAQAQYELLEDFMNRH